MVNFGPIVAEIVSLVWGTPANFNGFRVLAALLHSQTAALNRGRHLYPAGRPSRWALAHSSSIFSFFISLFCLVLCGRLSWLYASFWAHVNVLHRIVSCLNCEDIARQSCAMVPRWRFFGEFLRPVFSANRVQQVSDLHYYIRTKATPCVEVWQTSNLRRLRLGEEKKNEEERRNKKPQDENTMVCPIA